MTTDQLFAEHCSNREKTDDGGFIDTWTVVAQGFTGVRQYNAGLVSRGREPILVWIARGKGQMHATFTRCISGIEVAIERQNDAWACRQQQDEDAGLGVWG